MRLCVWCMLSCVCVLAHRSWTCTVHQHSVTCLGRWVLRHQNDLYSLRNDTATGTTQQVDHFVFSCHSWASSVSHECEFTHSSSWWKIENWSRGRPPRRWSDNTDWCWCTLPEAVWMTYNRHEWRRLTGFNGLRGSRCQEQRQLEMIEYLVGCCSSSGLEVLHNSKWCIDLGH